MSGSTGVKLASVGLPPPESLKNNRMAKHKHEAGHFHENLSGLFYDEKVFFPSPVISMFRIVS